MRSRLGFLCTVLLVGLSNPIAAAAQATPPAVPQDWSRGYTLVLLEPGADPNAALRRVHAEGGTVGVVVPPALLLGWIAPEADARLVGQEGIRSIHRGPVGAAAFWVQDPVARAALRTFDRAVRGELIPASASPGASGVASALPPLHDDAREPGPVEPADVLASLRAAGHGGLAKQLRGATIAGNSDYMTGTVSLTLFFVESNGTGSDPDLNDWTAPNEQEVIDDAIAGLSWWSQQARDHGDCWVAFYVRAHFATQDARCGQWREPVLHDSGTYTTSSIYDVLGNFGYSVGNVWSRATAYNQYQKSTYGTDWAYCAFVAPNPNGPNQFTDGYAAWAYLGGPFSALLQYSFAWPFGQVFAHESGHIFRACDEYYQEGYGGCTSCGVCGTTGALNGNCEFCNPAAVGCMMRASSWLLCSYTPAQLGWTRTPCAPLPLPAPAIVSVQPPSAVHADTAIVQIQGQNFTYGTQVDMGGGVEVLAVETVSASQLDVTVHVDQEATPGPRTVRIATPDLQTDSLVAGFQVLATRRHYLAAAGLGIYPYTSAGTAATSFTAALAACSHNDTLFVDAGTYPPVEIHKSLTLLGGWNASFTARDPVGTPTRLQGEGAGPVARLSGSGRSIVLDGFTLSGGTGNLLTMPGLGTYLAGGGVQAFQAAVTLRHCLLEDNTAGTLGTPGTGGGGLFWRSDTRLEDCVVRSNHATRGGGVFFLESAAHLQRNRFEDNDGSNCAETILGAGIGAASSTLELLDDVIQDNRGAENGGGMHLENCPRVELEGVTISGHTVPGSGGGIWAHSTRLVLRASAVLRDSATIQGGGIRVDGDSLEVVSSTIAGNAAVGLGGGIHASNCTVLLHNATLARNTGSYASGIFAQQLAPGSEVRNSILASNAFGGFVVSSGTMPAADYNLLWGNGGLDYLGITPGGHDQFVDPLLVDPSGLDLHLGVHSPAIDAGDPTPAANDPDGSRNDRGAYGGPGARPAAPPRVTGCTATALPQGVRLGWHKSPSPDVQWYALYRGADSTFVPGTGNFLTAVGAPDTTWLDTTAPAGAWYCIAAVDSAGYAGGYAPRVRAAPPSDVMAAGFGLRLHAVSPCVSGRGTWVAFELAATGDARLELFTIDGRLVRGLAHGTWSAGPRRLFWDGRDAGGRTAAAGVYLLRLQAGEREVRQKLVVTR